MGLDPKAFKKLHQGGIKNNKLIPKIWKEGK
jgi:hypothetical protein